MSRYPTSGGNRYGANIPHGMATRPSAPPEYMPPPPPPPPPPPYSETTVNTNVRTAQTATDSQVILLVPAKDHTCRRMCLSLVGLVITLIITAFVITWTRKSATSSGNKQH